MGGWSEISEMHAEGKTLALYEEIRAVTEMPLVNLVFRHLATIPRGLLWVWTTLRPLYESGAAASLGAAVIENARFPALPPIPGEYLSAAGLSMDDLKDIAVIIDFYIRGNSMNLLAMSAMCRFIDGAQSASVSALSRGARGSTSLPPFDRKIRPILSVEDLDGRTRALIACLNKIGQSTDPDSVKPSLYRHLAHWPSFLSLAGTYLLLPDSNGSLATATTTVRDSADRVALEISGSLRSPKRMPPGGG
jgi:hypothetical protein